MTMKRAVAFILSLTVIWLQMLASAQTFSGSSASAVAPECGCCVQKDVCRCCCVAPAEPDAKPLPAVPVATSASFDFSLLMPRQVAWLLPATAPAVVASSESSSLSPAVSLFKRHCALLI
jgi:hypothetical protein